MSNDVAPYMYCYYDAHYIIARDPEQALQLYNDERNSDDTDLVRLERVDDQTPLTVWFREGDVELGLCEPGDPDGKPVEKSVGDWILLRGIGYFSTTEF